MTERLTYSVTEAGRSLGVCSGTIRNYIARGELPAVRIGRRVLISARALADFVAERES